MTKDKQRKHRVYSEYERDNRTFQIVYSLTIMVLIGLAVWLYWFWVRK